MNLADRIYALIFNGITRASSAATDRHDGWLPLSERERFAQAVFVELRTGNIEFRLGPLAELADAADREQGGTKPQDVVHLIHDGSATTSCCRRTPFELPRHGGHLLTVDPGEATCPVGREQDREMRQSMNADGEL